MVIKKVIEKRMWVVKLNTGGLLYRYEGGEWEIPADQDADELPVETCEGMWEAAFLAFMEGGNAKVAGKVGVDLGGNTVSNSAGDFGSGSANGAIGAGVLSHKLSEDACKGDFEDEGGSGLTSLFWKVARFPDRFTYWLRDYLPDRWYMPYSNFMSRHFWARRRHLVDCRERRHDSDPYIGGWTDSDYLILLANFRILTDFMEGEKPGQVVCWDSDDTHRHAWAEMTDLYDWWTVRRKGNYEKLDKLRDDWYTSKFPKGYPEFEPAPGEIGPDGETCYKLKELPEGECPATVRLFLELEDYEAGLEGEDTDNLIRLIRIREFLWT